VTKPGNTLTGEGSEETDVGRASGVPLTVLTEDQADPIPGERAPWGRNYPSSTISFVSSG
jgi:hypothetical protein